MITFDDRILCSALWLALIPKKLRSAIDAHNVLVKFMYVCMCFLTYIFPVFVLETILCNINESRGIRDCSSYESDLIIVAFLFLTSIKRIIILKMKIR